KRERPGLVGMRMYEGLSVFMDEHKMSDRSEPWFDGRSGSGKSDGNSLARGILASGRRRGSGRRGLSRNVHSGRQNLASCALRSEVREQAVVASRGKRIAQREAPIRVQRGMFVREVRQIAADQDEVELALVNGIEGGHRGVVVVAVAHGELQRDRFSGP